VKILAASGHVVARGRLCIAEIRTERATVRFPAQSLIAIMQRRDCHQFALIETAESCIDQIFRGHGGGLGLLGCVAGSIPEVGGGRRRENGLHPNALVSQIALQDMAEAQDIGLGCAVDAVQRLDSDADRLHCIAVRRQDQCYRADARIVDQNRDVGVVAQDLFDLGEVGPARRG